ncbi:hypothetical protein GGR56DRAFT_675232 [Xylariaceae sp. FL0804]|nr:hypothetical protein GGR56DRAFT_675232 [Xylariaceae sp. FL0804]
MQQRSSLSAAAAAAVLLLLGGTRAEIVPSIYQITLNSAPCTDVTLTDKYTVHASCLAQESGSHTATSLDLNTCLANYEGSLSFRSNGGFGGSCQCELIPGKNKMSCACATGRKGGVQTLTNIVDLGDWNRFQVDEGGNLACGDHEGMEQEGSPEVNPVVQHPKAAKKKTAAANEPPPKKTATAKAADAATATAKEEPEGRPKVTPFAVKWVA